MKRSDGPLRVARTELLGDRVLVADLSGMSRGSVAAVRRGSRYYFVAPSGLAGSGKEARPVVREMPACSLTDCMNASVADLGDRLARRAPSKRRNAR